MKLTTYLLAKAILAFLDSKEVYKQVFKLSKSIDGAIDEKFGGKSEEIQTALVQKVFLPLCSDLMRENQLKYMSLLQIEYGVVRDEYHKDTPEVM